MIGRCGASRRPEDSCPPPPPADAVKNSLQDGRVNVKGQPSVLIAFCGLGHSELAKPSHHLAPENALGIKGCTKRDGSPTDQCGSGHDSS